MTHRRRSIAVSRIRRRWRRETSETCWRGASSLALMNQRRAFASAFSVIGPAAASATCMAVMLPQEHGGGVPGADRALLPGGRRRAEMAQVPVSGARFGRVPIIAVRSPASGCGKGRAVYKEHAVAEESTNHTWQFFRAGDFEQVALTSGADLLALDTLDQKLWAALGCPVDGLHFDRRTLELIDSDGDGRIRAPELIAAIKWAAAHIRNPDDLVNPAEALPLAAIDDASPEGAQMLATARHVLELLGKADADALSVDDTTEARERFAQMPFNGDGIVTHDAAEGNEAVQALIDDVIACLGADTDASGKPGVGGEKLDRFLADAAALAERLAHAESDPAIRVLGDATAEASAAPEAVRAKITDYFTRCRLAEFDARAVAAVNGGEGAFAAWVAADLVPDAAEIAALPLARIEPGKPLPLTAGINPAWEERIGKFRSAVVVPLLGERTELTLEEWR